MELKATKHSYYCNDENYTNAGAFKHYDSWKDFRESWLDENCDLDHDYNHCFRFDLEEDEEEAGDFTLKLYIMHQRKGNFVPITIKTIQESDMTEINTYLEKCWHYLQNQWKEFSK